MTTVTEFTIKNRRGNALFCRHHEPLDSRASIIACHGIFSHQGNGDGKSYLLAQRANESGLGVVRFDFAGCGRSEGLFADSCLSARIADLEDVVENLLHEQIFTSRRPLFLVGSSMGGSVVICYAGRHPYQVKALAAWAAPADMAKNMEALSPELYRRLQQGHSVDVQDWGRWFTLTPEFLLDLEKVKPIELIGNTNGVAKLLIHGERDEAVPFADLGLLFAAAPEPKLSLSYPLADHMFAGFESKLVNDTVRWLETFVDEP